MAVYTDLNRSEVEAFVQGFGWQKVVELKATDSGIENTNYFVTATNRQGKRDRLVLTLFEKVPISALPYFVELTTFLTHKGLPVPSPYRDQRQVAVHRLKSKPALLVPCFAGQHPQQPSLGQCQAIAAAMARMHLASAEFSMQRENVRGLAWRQHAVQLLSPILDVEQRKLLQHQANDWAQQQDAINALPHGITHNDLFHDNALFVDDQLTGIIDFYQACHDVLIYDLAVLVNDWCSDGEGQLIDQRYQVILQHYQQLRPFTKGEQALWPKMLGYAALRFWISRLLSWHDADSQGKVAQKNPDTMRRMLLRRIS